MDPINAIVPDFLMVNISLVLHTTKLCEQFLLLLYGSSVILLSPLFFIAINDTDHQTNPNLYLLQESVCRQYQFAEELLFLPAMIFLT